MSDKPAPATLAEAIQQGLVDPLKTRLAQTDARLRLLTLLLAANLLTTAGVLIVLIKRG